MSVASPMKTPAPMLVIGKALALVLVELLVLSAVYQHNFDFTCRASAPESFCAFAGRIVPRALGVIAALALFAFARKDVISRLLQTSRATLAAVGVNLTGLVLILLPWLFVSDASAPAAVVLAAITWVVGGLLAVLGICLILAPWSGWRGLLRDHGAVLAVLILAGLALPEIADAIMPLWQIDGVTEATFAAVAATLRALGYSIETIPDEKIIGTNEFYVAVGAQCSGVEGFALITVFVTVYLLLFRKDLRFPYVLLLYPIGIVVSWLFNVLRISALLSIGAAGSPELAIGGFHSHAGWLAFTLLALGLIFTSRAVPLFRKTKVAGQSHATPPPFFSDPVVARVFPFIIFMASALLASTFSQTPTVLYPLRVLVTATGLYLFWPYLKTLNWRLDFLAVATGLLIGVGWIVTASDTGDVPFGSLTGIALIIWVITRIIGTAILVPIIEEFMFRSYILGRIAGFDHNGDGPVVWWRVVLAVGVSSGLFALLHGRWVEALLAGVIFGLLYIRSRNVVDSILSHAVANSVIALFALVTGAWHIL